MLQITGLTPHGYALTVTLFSVAYAVFEIPSNWIMKHYIRPSMWLGILLFAWGALTIGFAGVQNTASIVALRFLIGAFEAGFFPGGLHESVIYYIHTYYFKVSCTSSQFGIVTTSVPSVSPSSSRSATWQERSEAPSRMESATSTALQVSKASDGCSSSKG